LSRNASFWSTNAVVPPGYSQDGGGVCRRQWTVGRIVGLAVAAAVLTCLVTTVICLRLRRRRRLLAFDLDLHKGLLEETTNDVMALKRAWEIDWADVALTTRIDTGTEGAFGEVT